jgi:hypothetical protein
VIKVLESKARLGRLDSIGSRKEEKFGREPLLFGLLEMVEVVWAIRKIESDRATTTVTFGLPSGFCWASVCVVGIGIPVLFAAMVAVLVDAPPRWTLAGVVRFGTVASRSTGEVVRLVVVGAL